MNIQTLVVLSRSLSNVPSSPLVRAIRAYRELDLSHAPKTRPECIVPKRAKHLNEAELARLVDRYGAGATVYDLAAEFSVNRNTVARRLKEQGILLRHTPTAYDIDEMIGLYRSGLSLARVGIRLAFSARTVLRCLQDAGVQTRDSHGRDR